MNRMRWIILALPAALIACQTISDKDTIARLRHVQIDIKEEQIDGGLDKAMTGYQRFLEETPESALAPEAMRRLADLKIENEYGTLVEDAAPTGQSQKAALPSPERAERPEHMLTAVTPSEPVAAAGSAYDESEADFQARATRTTPVIDTAGSANAITEGADDLDRASTREAIALYKKLLDEYPLYERNDQVLYQMSRAYEELGRSGEAMQVMDNIVSNFPESRYIDEVQFRRAEYFFTRKRYLDAENAYKSIVKIGVGSFYYELALYKLGWTFYKQELYEEALNRYIALLDHKLAGGYDFEQTEDEQERKRTEDTFRVISLSFSNLGGAEAVVDYFSRHGKRAYENSVYSNLGEYYFDKRRYADACASYTAFVRRNPFHKQAPNFHMRVIDINIAGGFPSLVLEEKKSFATAYGLKAEYWKYFEPEARPDVIRYLKTNLVDLANHYHAWYQKPPEAEDKPVHFKVARYWYREFLTSFPQEKESPGIHYQLADLLLENRSFGEAAIDFEKTAYTYPSHEKSAQAGYAAVYAYREHLAGVASEDKDAVKHEVVRSSLKFADTFPDHEKVSIVLGAAADDLYAMQEFEQALSAARKLIEKFPDAETAIVRDAWLVAGHSSFELTVYSDAEAAYLNVLELLPVDDASRDDLIDNLAASIYKQGEQAEDDQDYRLAANHFLRVGRMAPTSKIRPTAEYDGAAALIQIEDWAAAAAVLEGFRENFQGHPLQPEVTKKMAYVYRENGQLLPAANEYERIEKESQDDAIRREALLVAASLYAECGDSTRAMGVYRRYVDYFPQPVEINLETRDKIAEILKAQDNRNAYLNELRQIVAIDAAAGAARSPRTFYLAAGASLVLAEDNFDKFTSVALVQPFEPNLLKKKKLMKSAVQKFSRLMDYEIGEFTAAATFYLAEIYAHFSQALMTSERPEGLSALEKEEYELAIEEQAYPFEEKAIDVHESNLKLMSRNVYNQWIDKSLEKLAVLVPVRYAKPETQVDVIASLETFVYEIEQPAAATPAAPAAVVQTTEPAPVDHAMAEAGADRAVPGTVGQPGPAADGRPATLVDDADIPSGDAMQKEKFIREEAVQ
jgi:outer membrane protein assembly factor BamD (BamD/ComL family)